MRKPTRTLMAVSALAAGIAAATSLHADDAGDTEGHGGMTMGPGMMDNGGMMPMMEQMSDMMDHCSQMMQGTGDGGSGVPNEQWQKDAPVTPENDG